MLDKNLPALNQDFKQIIQLGADIATIEQTSLKYHVVPTDTKSLNALKEGIAIFRGMRKTVTDTHKDLKAPVIIYGKELDAEKNKLLELIINAETPLVLIKDDFEAEKERIKKEKFEAEQARIFAIQAKIESFGFFLNNINNKDSKSLVSDIAYLDCCLMVDSFVYDEFLQAAEVMKLSVKTTLENALKERLIYEAEQSRLVVEAAKLEAEKAAFNLEKEKQEAERVEQNKIEAAKIAAQYAMLATARLEQEAIEKRNAATLLEALKLTTKPALITREDVIQVAIVTPAVQAIYNASAFELEAFNIINLLQDLLESGLLMEGAIFYNRTKEILNNIK